MSIESDAMEFSRDRGIAYGHLQDSAKAWQSSHLNLRTARPGQQVLASVDAFDRFRLDLKGGLRMVAAAERDHPREDLLPHCDLAVSRV